jgi:hypothetical protein
MMVHTWDTVMAVVKVVDHETGQEHFLDPEVSDFKDTFSYIQLLNFSKMVNHPVTEVYISLLRRFNMSVSLLSKYTNKRLHYNYVIITQLRMYMNASESNTDLLSICFPLIL